MQLNGSILTTSARRTNNPRKLLTMLIVLVALITAVLWMPVSVQSSATLDPTESGASMARSYSYPYPYPNPYPYPVVNLPLIVR